ncbi:MAG: hypothetical protein EKK51_25375 [Mycolicibacterium sp.]|uniref:anti-sigma-D factor RsdA n=1 Tax=Mycolicibacterium sp. TaxID=2320850 RepID=UPI000FBA64F3|nr:anti-sigma-D factor RsdA [Mycolicibacterium sp.]RUP28038.1 MAG: hypothetical protein EKK51_25375 [Mycolicibacterium sp.]
MPDSGQWSPDGGDPSLNEIRRVDRYFDALAADQHAYSTDSSEDELAFLFADWRDSIREPAVTTPITARDAVAALQNGLHRKESRASLTIVGSVAAALLCLGGFGTAIYTAGPNSSLYGLHTAMFGADKASRDDKVMLAAQTEMQQVQQLIDNGQWQQAQEKLQALSPTVQSVDAPEHKQQLIQQWNALTYKVVEQNPAATLPPPGEPQPVLPSSPLTLLPVPVVETASSSSTSTTSTTTSSSDATPSTSSTSTSASTSPSDTTGTSAATSATSPAETASSASSTAPSSSTVTSTSAASTSVATSVPTTVSSTATATATATATQSVTVPSSAPVVSNPATASPTATATVAPSPTQNPIPAQTVTTVAPTVTTPPAATPAQTAPPAPAVKETQQQEPTRERPVATTTTMDAPSGSGRGQH